MPNDPDLQSRFGHALDIATGQARAGEVCLAWVRAERSDFVRFNHGRIRQAGTVERAVCELRLIEAGRQVRLCLTLGADPDLDAACIRDAMTRLRATITHARVDPFLDFDQQTRSSAHRRAVRLPSSGEIVDTVCAAASGYDLVGFYAGGPMACGFASSLGHHHWHETSSWNFDYSVYAGIAPDAQHGRRRVTTVDAALRDKAVKASVGGGDWSAERVRTAIRETIARVAILRRTPLTLDAGRHRTLLDARAMADLLEMLAWGGFSARALASSQSPLARLADGDARLDPRVSLVEDLEGAGVPLFQADGYARPARLDLIRTGVLAGRLVSPRSAREFSLPGNGAAGDETPQALSLSAGTLAQGDALAALGTGVWVSNFWYLNFSDRHTCRVTGMTRFATIWVEDGEPVAPVQAMRFDDSLLRVLGDRLEALTDEAHWFADTSTYDGRVFGAVRAPGALLKGLDFTL